MYGPRRAASRAPDPPGHSIMRAPYKGLWRCGAWGPMKNTSVNLPLMDAGQLQEIADRKGISRNEVIRWVLHKWLRRTQLR